MRNSNIIERDFNRTEHDDFVLNVEPRVNSSTWVLSKIIDGQILYWVLVPAYE